MTLVHLRAPHNTSAADQILHHRHQARHIPQIKSQPPLLCKQNANECTQLAKKRGTQQEKRSEKALRDCWSHAQTQALNALIRRERAVVAAASDKPPFCSELVAHAVAELGPAVLGIWNSESKILSKIKHLLTRGVEKKRETTRAPYNYWTQEQTAALKALIRRKEEEKGRAAAVTDGYLTPRDKAVGA